MNPQLTKSDASRILLTRYMCWIGNLWTEFCFMHHFIFWNLDHFWSQQNMISIAGITFRSNISHIWLHKQMYIFSVIKLLQIPDRTNITQKVIRSFEYNYRPHPKDGEGNVFSLSTPGGGGVPISHNALQHYPECHGTDTWGGTYIP